MRHLSGGRIERIIIILIKTKGFRVGSRGGVFGALHDAVELCDGRGLATPGKDDQCSDNAEEEESRDNNEGDNKGDFVVVVSTRELTTDINTMSVHSAQC